MVVVVALEGGSAVILIITAMVMDILIIVKIIMEIY